MIRKRYSIQCGGFLEMEIEVQPIVIDWPKMAKIIRLIYVYC